MKADVLEPANMSLDKWLETGLVSGSISVYVTVLPKLFRIKGFWSSSVFKVLIQFTSTVLICTAVLVRSTSAQY